MTPVRKRSTRFAAVLWTAGLVALWCAAGAGAGAEEKQPPSPVTRKVTIDSTSFLPVSVVANVGDTVVWTNKDLFKHTVTAADGSFDSKDIEPGGTWSLTVKTAGAFDYACIYHSTMKGTLRVR